MYSITNLAPYSRKMKDGKEFRYKERMCQLGFRRTENFEREIVYGVNAVIGLTEDDTTSSVYWALMSSLKRLYSPTMVQ